MVAVGCTRLLFSRRSTRALTSRESRQPCGGFKPGAKSLSEQAGIAAVM